MVKCVRAVLLKSAVCLTLIARLAPSCLAAKESATMRGIFSGNITGDLVPSAYPVLKLNQSANNDSSLQAHYKEELEELAAETMALMAQQRKVFEALRKRAREQNRLFDDLSMAAQRQ